jgi:hypothetical protein
MYIGGDLFGGSRENDHSLNGISIIIFALVFIPVGLSTATIS